MNVCMDDGAITLVVFNNCQGTVVLCSPVGISLKSDIVGDSELVMSAAEPLSMPLELQLALPLAFPLALAL